MTSPIVITWGKNGFLHINEVDRFTNERHSTTIGTIGLPRLAHEVTCALFSDRLLNEK